METVEVGSTEGNEVVEGEVVGDGEDEEERRKRGLGWERGMGRGSEQVECASAFAEFRVVGCLLILILIFTFSIESIFSQSSYQLKELISTPKQFPLSQ